MLNPAATRNGAVAVLSALLLGSGCAASPAAAPSGDEDPTTTTSTAAAPTTTAAGNGSGGAAGFEATVSEVPAAVRERMDGVSMRPGCPVGYDRLRYLRLSHWDFGGDVETGELVVHEDVADDVVAVFRELFEQRFPIRRMILVDDYGAADDPDEGADDFASIEADNTSAFNCRLRTGSDTEFSEHSYGTAIDLNPIENPYVSRTGNTAHSRSVPYLDRSTAAPGVIHADGPVVAAFAAVGWGWGGDWTGIRDYQHFSRSGR